MNISRQWAMPSKNTFSIKPIKELIGRYQCPGISIDPFANSNRIASITNDIDPTYDTTHNMDALAFLQSLKPSSVDLVLFDPPYSPRQVSECYRSLGMTVNMETTQSTYWAKLKKEIARVTRTGGITISCSWNSGGIGQRLGFDIVEILMVPHGGWHNDTIVVVEKKMQETLG